MGNGFSRLTDQPSLDKVAAPLSRTVRAAYASAGSAGRHPLHPVFTDLPIGAWTTGLVLDAVAASSRNRTMARAADIAIAVGLAGAAAAAVTGLTDWSETSGRPRRTGFVHGMLNIAATTLYAASYMLRKSGSRRAGWSCAITGYGVALSAAYLGGDLVYDQQIGVMHAVTPEPEKF